MRTVYTIGIDFGTANSCIAYASYNDRGNGEVDPDPLHRPEVIPFHGRDTIPTAILLGAGPQQSALYRLPAQEPASMDPQRSYTCWKVRLSRADAGADAQR